MQKLIFLIFVSYILCISSCKTKVNEGDATLNLQLYKYCNEPYKNVEVILYKEVTGQGGFGKVIAQKITDDNGFVTLKHQGGGNSSYNLLVNNEPQLNYGGVLYNKTYSITLCTYANGGLIPIELPNFASYTNQDTVFYRVIGNWGTDDPNDLNIRYKIGPFTNKYIDTLRFTKVSLPDLLEYSQQEISVHVASTQDNILCWGKGSQQFWTNFNANITLPFQLVGCGIIDTLVLQ